MSLCEMHQDVQSQLREHERRLAAVEKSNGEILVRIDNLCEAIEGLKDELSGFVLSMNSTFRKSAITVITILAGFLIWYIQSLPR